MRVDGTPVGVLRVVSLAPEDLVREGETLFDVRDGAAPGPRPENTTVAGHRVENSNVEPVTEMVDMIRIYREYETNHKAMTVQGETLKRLIEQALRG